MNNILTCTLLEVLEANELTVQAVADKAGMPRSHLSAIAHNRKKPTLETALRIAAATGLPVDEIWALKPARRKRR